MVGQGGNAGAPAPDGASASGGGAPSTPDASNDAPIDAAPGDSNVGDADAAVMIGPGGSTPATATMIPLGAGKRLVLPADTALGTVDGGTAPTPPCSPDHGPQVFYRFTISRAAFVYADSFGAGFNTVLYFLSNAGAPLTTSTPGDATCNDDACGVLQSQVVAVLAPGAYDLAVTGRAGASGPVDVHFEWAFAPSGSVTQLPSGSSTQTGTTTGNSGSIDGSLLRTTCTASGPENSYWWTTCPSDAGGTLSASTCGGASFETVIETQIPGGSPAVACNVDACGLQASLTATIPAGAGLRVLTIDGQSESGPYSMSVTRP
jgi:hypothetical protein